LARKSISLFLGVIISARGSGRQLSHAGPIGGVLLTRRARSVALQRHTLLAHVPGSLSRGIDIVIPQFLSQCRKAIASLPGGNEILVRHVDTFLGLSDFLTS